MNVSFLTKSDWNNSDITLGYWAYYNRPWSTSSSICPIHLTKEAEAQRALETY